MELTQTSIPTAPMQPLVSSWKLLKDFIHNLSPTWRGAIIGISVVVGGWYFLNTTIIGQAYTAKSPKSEVTYLAKNKLATAALRDYCEEWKLHSSNKAQDAINNVIAEQVDLNKMKANSTFDCKTVEAPASFL